MDAGTTFRPLLKMPTISPKGSQFPAFDGRLPSLDPGNGCGQPRPGEVRINLRGLSAALASLLLIDFTTSGTSSGRLIPTR